MSRPAFIIMMILLAFIFAGLAGQIYIQWRIVQMEDAYYSRTGQ